MERVGRLAAVSGRVDQRPDDLEELDDRPWPAVVEDKRQRISLRRTDVEEVDLEPVDLGAELGQRVQARLARPPVVTVGPVRAQLLQVGKRDALRPVVDRLAVRPAGAVKALTKIVELCLRNLDPERRDLVGHLALMFAPRAKRCRS
jgi:hypothetical protein